MLEKIQEWLVRTSGCAPLTAGAVTTLLVLAGLAAVLAMVGKVAQ